jgi:hypothetical protein
LHCFLSAEGKEHANQFPILELAPLQMGTLNNL